MTQTVLAAQVAGSFYPGAPQELRRLIDLFLDDASSPPLTGEVLGLIVPHAGYVYSGGTAARAWRQVLGKHYEAVLIIGLAHRYPLRGMAIFPADVVETPLGLAPVAGELCRSLVEAGNGMIRFDPEPFSGEHSMEVQVPFVQAVLPEVPVIPALMGHTSDSDCDLIGAALARGIGPRRVLLAASTDLSHFPPAQVARQVDQLTLEVLSQFDAPALRRHISETMGRRLPGVDCVLCGEYPVMTTLAAARALGADGLVVLGYSNSADLSHDPTRTVGYGACALVREKN